MKKLTVLLATTLFVFFSADAQQILSGIYSGSMYNDSTKMLQKYELALSEYRGKVMGYSYVTFVVNDTFYYGIRRVKGFKNDKNELVLTDEELLANNFPESPAKRVKRTATFPLAQEDTISSLKGTWETNRTKLYYSVGGATRTERSVDSSESALVAHLQELKIITGKPDYQENAVAKVKTKKQPKAGVARVEQKGAAGKHEAQPLEPDAAKGNKAQKGAEPKGSTETTAALATNTNRATAGNRADKPAEGPASGTYSSAVADTKGTGDKKSTTPPDPRAQHGVAINERTGDLITEKPPANKPVETAKNNTSNKSPEGINGSPADAKKQPVQNGAAPGSSSLTQAPATANEQRKPGTKPGETAAQGPATNPEQNGNAGQPVTAGTKDNNNKGETPAGKPAATGKPAAVAAAAPLEQRTTNVIRTLEVVNDSITLSFYDNGVVDGDVISVFVNGQNVIASAKLNEVAMKKTIHLPTFAGDSVEVILVAETLGSIPPNTGLLLVHDGDKRYDVRFSADLKTNASIVFRKAKK